MIQNWPLAIAQCPVFNPLAQKRHWFKSIGSRDHGTGEGGALAGTELVGKIDAFVHRSTFIEKLSEEELVENFTCRLKVLDCMDESLSYGVTLREAEQMISQLEKKASVKREKEIGEMKAKFLTAFQRAPAGPGLLTQLEVDHLKKMTIAPRGVVCSNQSGALFQRPELSISDLTSIFYHFGFNLIKYSLKQENFEGIKEVCDVIGLGKKWTVLPWGKSMERLIVDSAAELTRHLQKDGFLVKLGYASFKVGLIKDLSDPEIATSLQEQGYALFVILIYPQVKDLNDKSTEVIASL
ncbi:MAG: hypothetical protein LLG04_12380 [Parachlamydia sp.]|nr:hypothetical protein [Parachlamydia sp.]